MLAPIILFVFNRPDHTRQAVEALLQNRLAAESHLFIYADGARSASEEDKVKEVRTYLQSIAGFAQKHVMTRETNWGLANNIMQGVSEVISKYKKAIVLEDDLICAPYFLDYMNGALEQYAEAKNIFSVSGYNPAMRFPDYYQKPVYLNYRNSSWGWATWLDRWEKVDWEVSDFEEFVNSRTLRNQFNRGGEDLTRMLCSQMKGRINSWAIRFTYAHFKNEAYSLCPVRSYIRSAGHDGSGTHSARTEKYQVELDTVPAQLKWPADLEVDENIMKEFRRFYRLSFKKRIRKMIMPQY